MVCVFVIQLSARLRHDAAHRRKPVGQRVTRTGLVCVFSLLHHVIKSFHYHGENLETAPKGSPKNCNVTFNWRFYLGKRVNTNMPNGQNCRDLPNYGFSDCSTLRFLILYFFLPPFCLKNTQKRHEYSVSPAEGSTSPQMRSWFELLTHQTEDFSKI